ncbi:MAG: MgtC/SapB family protein [Clostridia bacterium]|nr:MgtC/SapB family protein [Clostridia bacterium]
MTTCSSGGGRVCVDVWETVLRILAAACAGGLLGLERESHQRPAGLRTHTLVCVGSALLMIVSVDVAARSAGPADPARIAAQVVSGIGFLGAGTILREGPSVRGLTTAASLWVAAALGLALGGGYYLVAGVSTVVSLATLTVLSRLERALFHSRRLAVLRVVTRDEPGRLGQLAVAIGRAGANIQGISLEAGPDPGTVTVEFTVRLPAGGAFSQVALQLLQVDGVRLLNEGP